MEFRYTRHQVARGSRPDAINGTTWLLVKYVSELHLTYQIRLLTFGAQQSGARLVVRVPEGCRLAGPLRAFVKEHQPVVRVERVA